MGINHWDEAERPRERLLRLGLSALTPAEVVAIILLTGNHEKSAVDLGRELLERFRGIEGICSATDSELLEVTGIGPAKVAQLRATVGFSILRNVEKAKVSPQLCQSRQVYELVKCYISDAAREEFCGVMLNEQRRLIEIVPLAKGTVNKGLVYPREVVKAALRCGAANIILAHNHPSGDTAPSSKDKTITREIVSACSSVEINVLDHIIIGAGGYFSFQKSGLLKAGKIF